MELSKFLEKRSYKGVDIYKNAIGHYQLKVKMNDIEGNFILDTGASSTCVGFEFSEKFKLMPVSSEIRAAGAGAIDMETFESEIESLKIGELISTHKRVIIFDLTQINNALVQHNADKICGIIGADILEEHDAIISYGDEKLFLKELNHID